jgi:gamma-glutamyltranspeptidase / glutathione hydrolase
MKLLVRKRARDNKQHLIHPSQSSLRQRNMSPSRRIKTSSENPQPPGLNPHSANQFHKNKDFLCGSAPLPDIVSAPNCLSPKRITYNKALMRFCFIVVLTLSMQPPIIAQSRAHARSMVITTSGIVATSQTLASQAGAQILARGGSAIDAAIAANAVLGVMEPMMDGMGGDLFAIHWNAKTGKFTGLNSSGPAPKGLSIEFLKEKGIYRIPDAGIHSVTVPGAVAGWAAMHKKFGKLPWRDLFQPAIYYAANGFPVTETIQAVWHDSRYQQTLLGDDSSKEVYLPGGNAPAVGELFRNPGLAHALQLVADQGPSAFYDGAIAQSILATSKRLGGSMQASDLSSFQPEWVTPISTTYRGWTIYELPPNGQGIAALQMLNVMENFPIRDHELLSVETYHTRIEAMKLAFADLGFVADPRVSKVPVDGMLAKDYATERSKLLNPERANCTVPAGAPKASSNTVYLSVVDSDGNIASWIQSVASAWGSGIVADRMGFILQNRGSYFEIDPSHPNALAPGKRPRHSIIPAFMEKDDIHIGFGIMGGSNQPMAHAQFVSNIVDYDMNIQAALDAPRFTKVYVGGCDILIEGRVPESVRQGLRDKGHELTVLGDYASNMGRGQAVLRNTKTNMNFGASTPRGDGAAVPQPDPYFPPAAKRK